MQPGRFAPPGFHVGPELPDDVSVTIRKQGKQPAEAEVKRGDQSWTVKDSDVSSLPEELRAPVEALLKHGEPFRVHSLPHIMIAPPAKPAAPRAPKVFTAPRSEAVDGECAVLEKSVDEMRASLREMRKEIESLRRDLREGTNSERR